MSFFPKIKELIELILNFHHHPIILSKNFRTLLNGLTEWESQVNNNLIVGKKEFDNYLKLSRTTLKLLMILFKPKKLRDRTQKKGNFKENIFYNEDFYREFIGVD